MDPAFYDWWDKQDVSYHQSIRESFQKSREPKKKQFSREEMKTALIMSMTNKWKHEQLLDYLFRDESLHNF